MTGAYTKSAFAGVVIISIFMLKYTANPPWRMNMIIFGEIFSES